MTLPQDIPGVIETIDVKETMWYKTCQIYDGAFNLDTLWIGAAIVTFVLLYCGGFLR
jgi:hypothetical protein